MTDYAVSSLAYDGMTRVATLGYSSLPGGALPEGDFVLTVVAASIASDTTGLAMGTDHVEFFHVLSGDVNGDRVTDGVDLADVTDNSMLPLMDQDPNADLDGDGEVTAVDVAIVNANLLRTLSPVALSVEVNGGEQQRSRVESVVVRFSADVGASLTVDDFTLLNVTAASEVDRSNWTLSYDAITFTAMIDFAGPADPRLPDGNYAFTLEAGGIETDAGDPMPMDGTVEFHVLAGDANGDRVTNDVDQQLAWLNLRRLAAKQDLRLDLNDDGAITIDDVLEVQGSYQATMPAPMPGPAMAPPTFELIVGGNAWSDGFGVRSKADGRPVAGWGGLDRIGMAFSGGAEVASGSLELIGSEGAVVGVSGFSVDVDSGKAEWRLEAPLANGWYTARFVFDGDGSTDLDLEFLVLEGDVDGDGMLTDRDLSRVEDALGGKGSRMDLDRNGVVDADDVARMSAILRTKE
jgi:hypothetical protein